MRGCCALTAIQSGKQDSESDPTSIKRISCVAAPDERAEHLMHRAGITTHDRGGGLDVADEIKVLPGEREPGVAGELSEKGTLRPPVCAVRGR
jgi:hypothetical protein